MKNFYDYLNENMREDKTFTLMELNEQWSNLDNILITANNNIRGRIVSLKPIKLEKVEIYASYIYYKRFIKKDLKLGNLWFIVDKNNVEYPINVNGEIKTFIKVNNLDPYGEEDWD